MRAWNQIHKKNETINKKNVKLSDVAKCILSKENSIEVNFHQTITETSKIQRKFARFPPNPEANWGPKRRAGKTKSSSSDDFNNSKDVGNDTSKDKEGREDNTVIHDHNSLSVGSTEVDHHENDKLTTTSTTTLNCDINIPHQSSPTSSPSTKKSKLTK